MILEALVTTTSPDGTPHVAPMGPAMSADGRGFVLKPFATSNTFRNLVGLPSGVLHVTDDALLLAQAAIGRPPAKLPVRPAKVVHGFVLLGCCRAMEFHVRSADTSGPRAQLFAEIVHTETLRDFWGFNRAKHAVLEAAIYATRLHLLSPDEVASEYARLRVIVEKTGGAAECDAMTMLEEHLARHRTRALIGGPGR